MESIAEETKLAFLSMPAMGNAIVYIGRKKPLRQSKDRKIRPTGKQKKLQKEMLESEQNPLRAVNHNFKKGNPT